MQMNNCLNSFTWEINSLNMLLTTSMGNVQDQFKTICEELKTMTHEFDNLREQHSNSMSSAKQVTNPVPIQMEDKGKSPALPTQDNHRDLGSEHRTRTGGESSDNSRSCPKCSARNGQKPRFHLCTSSESTRTYGQRIDNDANWLYRGEGPSEDPVEQAHCLKLKQKMQTYSSFWALTTLWDINPEDPRLHKEHPSIHSNEEAWVEAYVRGMSRTPARAPTTWEHQLVECYMMIIDQKTGKPAAKEAHMDHLKHINYMLPDPYKGEDDLSIFETWLFGITRFIKAQSLHAHRT
jgi:hypothetical protein